MTALSKKNFWGSLRKCVEVETERQNMTERLMKYVAYKHTSLRHTKYILHTPSQDGDSASSTLWEQIAARNFWHPLAETRTGFEKQNSLG